MKHDGAVPIMMVKIGNYIAAPTCGNNGDFNGCVALISISSSEQDH
jgi:hypothetical protein